jgi:hypothetical protein
MNELIMETGRGEIVFFKFNSMFALKSGLFDQMSKDIGRFIKCSLLETVREISVIFFQAAIFGPHQGYAPIPRCLSVHFRDVRFDSQRSD